MKKYLKKEHLPLYIVGIISLVVVGFVVNYTYSFFAVNKTNNNVIAGEAESMSIDLKVEKKAPNNDNKLVPQLDEYITSAVKGVNGSCVDGNNNNVCQVYKITVKNGGSTTTQLNGEVVLDAKNNPNLKWAVISGEATSGAKPTLKSNVYLHTHKQLTTKEEYTGGQTKEYYIVVWISETGLDQTDTGKFTGVVNFTNVNSNSGDWGTTSIDNSGANAPAYTEGLIPVMYDESTSKWVKADTTSSTSEYAWYDYDNKKWANAVLVRHGYHNSLEATNKTVNITNNQLDSYTSANQWDDSTDSEITFEFTTGSNGGGFTFEYEAKFDPWEEDTDSFNVKINNNSVISLSTTSCEYTYDEDSEYNYCNGSYTTTLMANTTYTMVATYSKDDYDDWGVGGYAKIFNMQLPSGTSDLEITNDADYSWTKKTTYSQKTYSEYFIDEGRYYFSDDNGNNTLTGDSLVDRYVCSDLESTECDEIYKIKNVNGNIITNVEVRKSEYITLETNYDNVEPGTEIPKESILAYYVWIPRYKYKVWNINKVMDTDSYNAQTTGIDIEFEVGTSTTGDVTCVYDFSKTATDTIRNEECTGQNGVSYYTHPAFTFGEDELTGFWIGKFELSSAAQIADNYSGGTTPTITPRIIPNAVSWRKNSISNFYMAIKNMQANNNIYGLSTDTMNTDSHMLTNMEWGAVAYLTNSKYGRCTGGENSSCTEVSRNNSRLYTGRSSGDLPTNHNGGGSSLEGSYTYETANGQLASTTGNIYGVYDMSGGSNEYVMSNASSQTGVYKYNPQEAGDNYMYSDENSKYLTTYAYGTTNKGQTTFNRTRLGDALGEVSRTDQYAQGWYNDYLYVTYSIYAWSVRGGYYAYSPLYVGLFDSYTSVKGEPGLESTRAALAVY